MLCCTYVTLSKFYLILYKDLLSTFNTFSMYTLKFTSIKQRSAYKLSSKYSRACECTDF